MQGAASQVALHHVASELDECAPFRLGLHTLSGDHQVHTMAHLRHGTHQLLRARCAVNAVDKASVNLQLADRKLVQVSQRRIARAKVVDGQRQTQYGGQCRGQKRHLVFVGKLQQCDVPIP